MLETSSPIDVVRAFVAAWNRHDIEALLAAVSDDLVWYGVRGESTVVELSGAENLRTWLAAFFRRTPTIRSEAEGFATSGSFVSYVETAIESGEEGIRCQSAIAVYEVVDGKIRRAWYFPAESAD